jgi:hypothetical protein
VCRLTKRPKTTLHAEFDNPLPVVGGGQLFEGRARRRRDRRCELRMVQGVDELRREPELNNSP